MNLGKAEQAILNAIYGAVAWLLLDFGLLFREQGGQALDTLASRPEMAAGAFIVLACIAGLVYKSRLAAVVLFLVFLIPQLLGAVQGRLPSTMTLLFYLILLYLFLAGMLGAFRYHYLKTLEREADGGDRES